MDNTHIKPKLMKILIEYQNSYSIKILKKDLLLYKLTRNFRRLKNQKKHLKAQNPRKKIKYYFKMQNLYLKTNNLMNQKS